MRMARWLVLACVLSIATIGAASAEAHLGPHTSEASLSAQQRMFRLHVKHAGDVARFFTNHPRLAQKQAGRDALWQHTRMRSWATERLTEVNTLIRRRTVVRRLEKAIQGTPLQGSAGVLERVAWKHGISPFFIVAVSATESSIGHAACYSNRKNIWGLSSCGSGWYVPHFRSWGHAYRFYAAFLNRRWPTATTAYDYHGYAACSPCWGRKTALWMRSLFGVGPNVRYV